MKAKVISAIIGILLGSVAAIYGHSTQSEAYIPQYISTEPFYSENWGEPKGREKEIKIEYIPVLLDAIPMDGDLQIYAQEKCREYGISYSMFLAFCESESNFKDYGEVEDGKYPSYGRMQIRKCNWDRYDGLDVRDPYDNLEIGIRMIAELKEKYMDTDKIIMAYKGGESAMLNWTEQGIRLDICDVLEERMMFWEVEINGLRNEVR